MHWFASLLITTSYLISVINLFYVFVNQTGSVSLAQCVRFCRAVLAFAGRCGWKLCNYNVWLSEQDVLAFNA